MESTSLFSALSKIAPVEASKVNMISLDDKYAYPPFFRFKFKGFDKDDDIYILLESIVNRFNGNLEWSLITKSQSRNFILIPKIFEIYLDNEFYNINNYIKKMTLSKYKKNIDLAIDDISSFGSYIILEYNKKAK
ncbi:MAG: hypothetical protein ABIP27_17300 [Flavobacterium circumlabens]|uniref:hypothetical protein n=1 Tax=Flavobacterium TaxID=237 RepID=UPI0012AEE2D6|nr:hypothetical protein [Flavobacterium sp. LC2016-23]MRX41846.1 hypothetical protein [Flavobacterium sp. LC2016-23]